MTLTRRIALGAFAAAALATSSVAAMAQDWRARYPELVFAVVPAENASGVTQRYQPLMDYLARELGVRVTLRIAADYAAVIEGQRAGTIHIAEYGPSAYVRAWTVSNGGVEPFVTTMDLNGDTGYFSVAYAKASAPGTRLEDFRGKNLCLVDPNSTSGNNVPLYSMNKSGINPEQFFAKVTNAGSHENAVMAVQQGTCDLAFNWWNSERDSNLSRMVNKGMVKMEDFKIVFRSDKIPGSPFAYLTSMPPELKKAINDAFVEMPRRDKALLDRLTDSKSSGFAPVKHSDYQVTIELQQFVDRLRRQRGS
jgi:phosphonate transport system substrate-binding protein